VIHDPRAEELLREAWAFLDPDVPMVCEDWPATAADIAHAIRAYLDEPRGEPQYTWHVVWTNDSQELSSEHGSEAEAEARGALLAFPFTIERAQLGPWEAVK
jgi:hypothetical protein